MNQKFSLFIRVLSLFLLTQILGVWLAVKLLPQLSVAVADISEFTASDLIYIVIFAAIFFFAVYKFPRFSSVFYKLVLSIIIFSASQTVLSIWLARLSFASQNLGGLAPITALAGGLAALALFWLYRAVWMQDLVMLLTLAGIGAIFGLALTPLTVVIILVILSFYDIIAVYKTGHMVKLAETMIQARAIFGFIIPTALSGFRENVTKVRPGEEFMILGSGDVILPLLLAASLVRISVSQAAVVVVFACLGLLITNLLFTSQKTRRPMAALPPIAAMSIIGYLVASLSL